MKLGLEGRVIIITGAASGIGRAMANSFCAEGAHVFGVDRDGAGIAAMAEEAATQGGEIATFVADLTHKAQVESIVDAALERFGTVDVLINNAGVMDRFQPVDELEDDIWDRNMAVNADAPMRLMRKAIRVMLAKGGGSVINVISMSSISGASAGIAYTASKSAMQGLTRATAWAYAERGIRCNAILPGATMTNIGKSIDGGVSQAGFDRSSRFHALMPVRMEAQDMADVALFLASDRAVRISGAEISADGGWCAC